ncbi:phosphodiesterase [Gryllotalpicola ginsengisoli]|uniref:phosphodiesterase n=1 Tax=Gryllotalpicola ginsengisoli TaxID=444608 RepID=UPI0003B6D7E6|nr:phosphodiesterase [Gryllotalpicola ginsengisoli]
MHPLLQGEYPEPDQVIVHLSDTHFTAGAAPLLGGVDSDANLAQALRALPASGLKPAAIVVTGDVADTGADDAYRRVRGMLEPVAAELGARLVWVMGNHDLRGPFRAGLLDAAPGEDPDAPVDAVHDLDGLRLVVLDSSVPGFHYGRLEPEQLQWLRDVLATPAPRGTVLALHHPPIPSPSALNALIELKGQDGLEQVVRGSDVRAILAGHLHYATHSTFAGVPVSVASATCYTNDVVVVEPGLRAVAGGQSFDLVHVYGDRMVHTTVPITAAPTLYKVTAQQLEQLLAAPEEVAREAIRRYVTVGALDATPFQTQA